MKEKKERIRSVGIAELGGRLDGGPAGIAFKDRLEEFGEVLEGA